MTRDQNKKFLKIGLGFFSVANVVVINIILRVEEGQFVDDSMAGPVLVILLGITAIPAFLFLVLLGVMPWLFRWQHRYLLSEKEQEEFAPMGFFMIED